MIDGSSCLQGRIFSEVSRVIGSEDTQSLFVGERGERQGFMWSRGWAEVIEFNGSFGWYLL